MGGFAPPQRLLAYLYFIRQCVLSKSNLLLFNYKTPAISYICSLIHYSLYGLKCGLDNNPYNVGKGSEVGLFGTIGSKPCYSLVFSISTQSTNSHNMSKIPPLINHHSVKPKLHSQSSV